MILHRVVLIRPGCSTLFQLLPSYSVVCPDGLQFVCLNILHQLLQVLEHLRLDVFFLPGHHHQKSTYKHDHIHLLVYCRLACTCVDHLVWPGVSTVVSAVHNLPNSRPFLLGSWVLVHGGQIQGWCSSQADDPHQDRMYYAKDGLLVGVPGASHHASSGGASAIVLGLAQVRDGLCSLDSSSATYSVPCHPETALLVANLVFMSTNRFSSKLGPPVWLGGTSGGRCIRLAVCLLLFLGVSGAADFVDLDLGAMA